LNPSPRTVRSPLGPFFPLGAKNRVQLLFPPFRLPSAQLSTLMSANIIGNFFTLSLPTGGCLGSWPCFLFPLEGLATVPFHHPFTGGDFSYIFWQTSQIVFQGTPFFLSAFSAIPTSHSGSPPPTCFGVAANCLFASGRWTLFCFNIYAVYFSERSWWLPLRTPCLGISRTCCTPSLQETFFFFIATPGHPLVCTSLGNGFYYVSAPPPPPIVFERSDLIGRHYECSFIEV